jgi:hypothetical protein
MRAMSLFVVDTSADTADVLSAVYEPRGVRVTRVRPTQSPESSFQTSVLIGPADESSTEVLRNGASIVLTGRVRLAEDDSEEPPRPGRVAGLPPLFRYADLISAIDEALQDAA